MTLEDTARTPVLPREVRPTWVRRIADRCAALRPDRHKHLLTGTGYLFATVVVSAVGSFVFWLLAAHLYPASSIGRASALFNLALFANFATSMGLPIALSRYAPDRSSSSQVLFNWSLLYTVLTSAVGTLFLLALVPPDVVRPLWAWGEPVGTLLFFSVVAAFSFAVLVDVRLMTLRRWRLVSVRSLFAAFSRLPLLALQPIRSDALWLFLLIAGTPAISGILGLGVLRRIGGADYRTFRLPPSARAAFRYASVNFLSILAAQAPFLVLPLIVLLNVPPRQNAAFYVAWSIAVVVFLVPQTIGQVLLVEGGKDGTELRAQVRIALVLALGFSVAATIAAFLASGLLPVLYGPAYRSSARILPWLVAAAIAGSIPIICVTEIRVREKGRATIALTVLWSAAIIVPAILLTSKIGVRGAVVSWLGGHAVGALLAVGVFVRMRRRQAHAVRHEVASGPSLIVALAVDELAGDAASDPARDLTQ